MHASRPLRPSAALAAALLAAAAAGPAAAQSGADAADIAPDVPETAAEAHIEEAAPETPRAVGRPQIRRDFDDGGFVRLYGHVNWGVLAYDDGRDSEVYAPLDNANSVSRLGLLVERPLGEGWEATVRLEAGYAPYSSGSVNQLDSDPNWTFNEDNIRWIDLNLRNDTYGAVSLGQGSMATDGITLTDFSGTNLIAYSSVADSAAGQFLRFSDPTLPIASAPRIGSAFQGYDGPRRLRVRYDTPAWNGLRAGAAYGRNIFTTAQGQSDEDLFDLSLSYAGDMGDFRLGAGAGYFWDRFDREILSGSASVLHRPTGLNASFASAELDDGARTSDYWWAKAGLRRNFFGVGDTALSIDYYSGREIAAAGSDSESIGLAVVQNLDAYNTELWLTWRSYAYDERAASFEDGRAIFGGLRFRF